MTEIELEVPGLESDLRDSLLTLASAVEQALTVQEKEGSLEMLALAGCLRIIREIASDDLEDIIAELEGRAERNFRRGT